jgi:hypothetical protein
MAPAPIASWKAKRTSQPKPRILTQVVWAFVQGVFQFLWLHSCDLRMGKTAEVAEARLNNPATSALGWQPSQNRSSAECISSVNPMTYEVDSTQPQSIEDEISELEARLKTARARLSNSRREQLIITMPIESISRSRTDL